MTNMISQPQYTFDAMGNKIGVFVPIDEYERLSGKKADEPVSQWESELIEKRMAEWQAAPDAGTPWEEVRQQMIEEDGHF